MFKTEQKTLSTQLYKLICEGECSRADARANVLRLERKLEKGSTLTGRWDAMNLGPDITLALRGMAKTHHRMVDAQSARCQRCNHLRPYGNSMFMGKNKAKQMQ